MTTPRAAYCRLLVQKASARTPGSPGNEITDILGKSRAGHTGLSNVTFWDLPTMQVYTPTPEFHAAHSVLQDPGPYPAPMLSGGFPVVAWRQTQGTVAGMAVLPDGSPPVYEIKVLDSDPAGAAAGLPWAFSTVDLGTWEGDYGAGARGSFGRNRGLAVTIRLGSADTPPADAPPQTDGATVPPGQAAPDGSSPGDVRVTVGTQWSVLFPAGGDPAFEQRYPYRDEDGVAHEWVRLHTFAGAVPSRTDGDAPLFLVTFLAVAGRLLVSVGGHSVASESFVYYKPG